MDAVTNNYELLYRWLLETGRIVPVRGTASMIDIQHDRWCQSQRAHVPVCDCEPNVVAPDGRLWTWAHYQANVG